MPQAAAASSSTTTTTDSCSSRHLSWLAKSCFPTPQQLPHHPAPLSSAAATTTTNISSLPDDLLLECLSRVPHSTLPSLPSVCRRWAHLLNSPSFRHTTTLFSFSFSHSALFVAALRFPNPSLWRVSSFVPSQGIDASDPNPAFASFSHFFRLVSIGRRIYIIGRTAMLCCDTWTGALLPRAAMGLPRKKFAAAAVAGKILVAGGCAAVEEYDPEEDAWRVVSHAPRRRYGCIGAAADGVFYVIGGLRIGSEVTASRAADACAGSMDLYDAAAGVWLRSRAVPGGGCVVAACAAGDGCVYVLASHAVEVSFWRFSAARGAGFGKWARVRGPPLPAQVRLDGSVRFGCAGVGDDKVVLVQLLGCAEREGLVLVYDCAAGEWSRAADMPEVIRRAACVCVQC